MNEFDQSKEIENKYKFELKTSLENIQELIDKLEASEDDNTNIKETIAKISNELNLTLNKLMDIEEE
tara:strand:- start:84 stop:284 length:201 start_codon:yes stop_codon:yes gene_type:complete